MTKELCNISTGITVKDLLVNVQAGNIPEDAWLNVRDPEGKLCIVKKLSLTDRDPEMGDIDLILEEG